MELTALSVGKSVLNGALSYAKSALAEEVALQLGVRRDQVFITNELEMMQAFLESAHDEGDENNRVVKVWVKQVRDVAYDVEDTLQEFAVRLQEAILVAYPSHSAQSAPCGQANEGAQGQCGGCEPEKHALQPHQGFYIQDHHGC
jgi:hypothetical protein